MMDANNHRAWFAIDSQDIEFVADADIINNFIQRVARFGDRQDFTNINFKHFSSMMLNLILFNLTMVDQGSQSTFLKKIFGL